MYFLIWIHETCNPGRCYGPMELLECDNKMRRYAREAINAGDLLDEYLQECHYINSNTGEGWRIIKTEEAD